jgi:hypothetical protein
MTAKKKQATTNAIQLTPTMKKVVKQAITNIKSKPDQFNMNHWIGENQNPKALRTCNTSACLAGHIVLAAGLRPKEGEYVSITAIKKKLGLDLMPADSDYVPNDNVVSVSKVAAAVLGVDLEYGSDSMDFLFIADEWPEPFRTEFDKLSYITTEEDEYTEIKPTKAILKKRANLAVKRLQYFLKTGE